MNASPGRIMVVDDQPEDTSAIIKALEGDGYAFVLAEDGQSALHLAASEHPDLIILDTTMPTLDGFGVAQALRERSETRTTPIIMVGEVESTDIAARSFQSGADDFVPKPIVPAHLRARVTTWLLRSEAR